MRTLKMRRKIWFASCSGIAVFLVFSLLALPAEAGKRGKGAKSKQSSEAAQLFDEGRKCEKAEDWKAAQAAFERALAAEDEPRTRLHLARAEEKLGNLATALEHYRSITESSEAPDKIRRSADKELQALEARVPTLQINLIASDFSGALRVDGRELSAQERSAPILVNPGNHVVEAEAEGFSSFRRRIQVSESDRKSIDVELKPLAVAPVTLSNEEPEPKSKRSTQTILGYTSLAAGGAGLVLGVAFGLAARSSKKQLEEDCPDYKCSHAQDAAWQQGTRRANVATAGFIAGGALVGLGAALLIFGPKKEKQNTIALTPEMGAWGASLRGSF